MPLPKNDEELESFRTGFAGLGSGLITDATDFDEDGVWEDSYGNVVTYFAPLHYYPSGRQYSTFNYAVALSRCQVDNCDMIIDGW